MPGLRVTLVLALLAVTAAGTSLLLSRSKDAAPEVAAASLAPATAPIDAARISSGKLTMERLPPEVGTALETYSEEIVRNAQAVATKQDRITGTCAPGSAIRVIAEDGSVRCQALPRGVTSVSAITAIPRLSSTTTEAASVTGGAGRYQSGGDDDYLVAPIALPDGAIVTSFSYTYFDGSPDLDGEAFLYRSDDQPLASVSSTGAAEDARTATTENIQHRKIDLARYAYFVYFQVSTKANARLMPISATVFYRQP